MKTNNRKNDKDMATLDQIFGNTKLTENGDIAYSSTSNALLDVLFMTEYYQKHLEEVPSIGTDEKARLFAMFIRDPRFGLGRRDLGRALMKNAGNTFAEIIMAGRYDDIWTMFRQDREMFHQALDFLFAEIQKGNELAKKWMPRYSSKNLMVAREIANYWGMNKQQYGHFIKADTTVEQKLSRHNDDEINFEHVPSLASIKYAHAFSTKETLKERYAQYMEAVKAGEKKLNVTTTTPYDLYKAADTLQANADIFFDKLEKISGSWIPVVDTSGSMQDGNDSFGKALSIGHYLAKCSTYAPNKVISFSSRPQLIELGVDKPNTSYWGYSRSIRQGYSQYAKEINSMYTGDCSNTDFGAVMRMLQQLDRQNAPEYIVVLSDMEFDYGSSMSKDATMALFRKNKFPTKIVWWNFNSRATTCPETDAYGNIFISGYNPMLLKFLEAGFNANTFLDKLLDEYQKYLEKQIAVA